LCCAHGDRGADCLRDATAKQHGGCRRGCAGREEYLAARIDTNLSFDRIELGINFVELKAVRLDTPYDGGEGY
jgi:hypothetical protein